MVKSSKTKVPSGTPVCPDHLTAQIKIDPLKSDAIGFTLTQNDSLIRRQHPDTPEQPQPRRKSCRPGIHVAGLLEKAELQFLYKKENKTCPTLRVCWI